MSDAKIQFQTLEGDPAEPGKEARFSFACPNNRGRQCGSLLIAGRTAVKRDGQNQNGRRAQWDWDGNREKPTFHPSVNCVGCWHGYIRGGRCVNTGDSDEPEPA